MHYDDEDGWYMDFPNGRETYRRMMNQNVLPEEEILYAMMNTHVFILVVKISNIRRTSRSQSCSNIKDITTRNEPEILRDILEERFQAEDNEHKTQDRHEGMEYEFGEIKASGTVDYFLDNHALVDLAVNKYQGQLTTTSRGSASSYYSSKLLDLQLW